MKKQIRLNESQLTNLIKESVKRVLSEISYPTAKSAYDKMMTMGQKERAARLAQTFSEINDDDDAEYDIESDVLRMRNDSNPLVNGGVYSHDKDDGGISAHFYGENDYDDTPVRTNNVKSAKNRARHLNNFSGTQLHDKNMFRA